MELIVKVSWKSTKFMFKIKAPNSVYESSIIMTGAEIAVIREIIAFSTEPQRRKGRKKF